MPTDMPLNQPAVREGYLPVETGRIYWREIGRGQPFFILHGGPDFNHSYLLPEMDRLSGDFRLIYYDQRGRGKSAGSVKPADVSLRSEISDLERLRQKFSLESVALLGHSWGGLLAMEYALQHPNRVSHLVLMNTAPASHEDFMQFRQKRRREAAADLEKMQTISSTPVYEAGDLEADAAYYRIHFRVAIRKPEHFERVIQSLRASFTPKSICKAREIENRLYGETWLRSDYNLLPRLTRLDIPTLVLHGEYDLIPLDCVSHVAEAIPGARLALLKDCGHFAFLESPDEARQEILDFFRSR